LPYRAISLLAFKVRMERVIVLCSLYVVSISFVLWPVFISVDYAGVREPVSSVGIATYYGLEGP